MGDNAFGPVEPLIFEARDLEIVDSRTVAASDHDEITRIWHVGMADLLRSDQHFVPKQTCVTDDCLGPLRDAYIDHVERRRANGLEPATWEQFSRVQFDNFVPDYVAKPHLPLHWFGIRRVGRSNWLGSICLSNIREIRANETIRRMEGWPVSFIPAISLDEQARASGLIQRFLMARNMITIDPLEKDIDFVHWRLPTHPGGRYVLRGTNTYGVEAFASMADGLRVRFDEEGTPVEIKRELESTDNPEDFPVYTRTV